jgi:hypothetical protein
VQQACTGEQEGLRTFALDHGLHNLLAAIKPDSARIRPSSKLPGRRRAQATACDPASTRATAVKSDAIAIKSDHEHPLRPRRQFRSCSCRVPKAPSTGHGL